MPGMGGGTKKNEEMFDLRHPTPVMGGRRTTGEKRTRRTHSLSVDRGGGSGNKEQGEQGFEARSPSLIPEHQHNRE